MRASRSAKRPLRFDEGKLLSVPLLLPPGVQGPFLDPHPVHHLRFCTARPITFWIAPQAILPKRKQTSSQQSAAGGHRKNRRMTPCWSTPLAARAPLGQHPKSLKGESDGALSQRQRPLSLMAWLHHRLRATPQSLGSFLHLRLKETTMMMRRTWSCALSDCGICPSRGRPPRSQILLISNPRWCADSALPQCW